MEYKILKRFFEGQHRKWLEKCHPDVKCPMVKHSECTDNPFILNHHSTAETGHLPHRPIQSAKKN